MLGGLYQRRTFIYSPKNYDAMVVLMPGPCESAHDDAALTDLAAVSMLPGLAHLTLSFLILPRYQTNRENRANCNKELKDRLHIHSLSGYLQMAGDVWLHNLLALGCFPGLSSWPAIAPIQLPKHV